MKDEIVNEIVCMLQRQGFEVEGISNKIYMILKDVDIVRKETALAVRDDIRLARAVTHGIYCSL